MLWPRSSKTGPPQRRGDVSLELSASSTRRAWEFSAHRCLVHMSTYVQYVLTYVVLQRCRKLQAYQRDWALSEFVTNGGGLRKHPLMPSNLEGLLDAFLIAEQPPQLLSSNIVCKHLFLTYVIHVSTYCEHIHVAQVSEFSVLRCPVTEDDTAFGAGFRVDLIRANPMFRGQPWHDDVSTRVDDRGGLSTCRVTSTYAEHM